MDDFRKMVRQGASSKWRLDEPAEDWRLGVSTMKALYDAGVESCVSASRDALRRMDLVVTGGDLRSTEARIDARSDLSELVRITVMTSGNGGSWVSFSAGRDWAQDGGKLIASLREAFEWSLNHLVRPPS
jgi:hypothetical protein